MEKVIHTIDASGKKLGRVATEAAVLLMGKNTPNYARNEAPDVEVLISNASKAFITAKKKDEKIYSNHSGYPGGLTEQNMAQVINKKGYAEVFKKAVYGMLPKNKLRAVMIKNLKITE